MRTYSEKQVAGIACLYADYHAELHKVNTSPTSAERENSASRLVNTLLPSIKNAIPLSLRTRLQISANRRAVERYCRKVIREYKEFENVFG